MKRFLGGVLIANILVYLAMVLPAGSGITCSLPFNLVNGTTADASQVMANYNALTACMLNNLAESGANSSITSLSGLTTPLSPAQGGTSVFAGGTSAGSTNAYTATASPTGFSLTVGYKIIFVASFSNTTGGTTLNVSGTGVKNLFRPTPAGAQALGGGDIVTGQIVEAVYDGTQYQMTSVPSIAMPPGAVFDYAGASGCPVGSLIANGGAAPNNALISVLSTTWGVSGTLPDLRGRATFSADSGGTGRITVAGGNFDGSAVGNVGGQQNQILSQAQLPVFSQTPTFTFSGGTASWAASNSYAPGTITANNSPFLSASVGSPSGVSGGAGAAVLQATSSTTIPGYNPTGTVTVTGVTGNINAVTFGSGSAHPVLSNAAIVLKCVKT